MGEYYFDASSTSKEEEIKNKNKGIEWLNLAVKHADTSQIVKIINLFATYHTNSNGYDTQARAIELGLQQANTGSAKSEYDLGKLYQQIRPDGYDKMAEVWYKKAAQQGNQDAQFELAQIVYSENHESGIKTLLNLANDNYKPAQCQLIILYNDQKNKIGYNHAIQWAKKAYDNQNSCGVDYLGDIYTQGKVVPQNYKTALEWYKKGHTQNAYAYNYNIQYTEMLIQKKKNTDALIKKAQNTHNPDLLIQYGQELIDGQNVFRKEKTGLMFLIKAANMGSTKAKNAVASNYDREESEIYNHGFALIWSYRADTYKKLDMQLLLNKQLKNSQTTTINKQNNDEDNLVKTYLKNGVIQKTLSLLENDAKQNNEQALLSLVIIYAQGKDVPKDQNKARFYLTKLLYKHDYRGIFKIIISYIIHARTREDFINAQTLLDSFSEKLHNDAQECNKAAEKANNPIMCEHGLVDLPLYIGIDGLSGVVSIKLHRSQEEIQNGIRQLKEYSKLLEYYEQTALYTQGSPGILLAELYMTGRYIPKDYQKAKSILETVMKYNNPGNSQAMYLLGTMSQQGLGIKKDIKTANDYFNVACLLQNENACHVLRSHQLTH